MKRKEEKPEEDKSQKSETATATGSKKELTEKDKKQNKRKREKEEEAERPAKKQKTNKKPETVNGSAKDKAVPKKIVVGNGEEAVRILNSTPLQVYSTTGSYPRLSYLHVLNQFSFSMGDRRRRRSAVRYNESERSSREVRRA